MKKVKSQLQWDQYLKQKKLHQQQSMLTIDSNKMIQEDKPLRIAGNDSDHDSIHSNNVHI